VGWHDFGESASMQNNPYKAYQKTQVMTAKPEKILLMLYEGAIKFTKLAAVRMREKNISEKGKYISKTLSIVSELMNTLDHEKGGQIAADLENLYMFIMDKLIEANMNNRVEELEVAERLLTTLYTAWRDVVNNPRPDGVPSPTLQPELAALYNQAQAGDKSQR
jgi:flagellar protein FliS